MYEIPDSTNMIVSFLGKGETLSDKSRKSLSKSIIEAFNMIRLSGFFAHCLMPISGNHCFIRLPKISIGNGTLSVHSRQRSPKLAS